MKRIPLWCDGEITLHAIASALNAAGFHVHSDRHGQTVVDEVPDFLRATDAVVVPIAAAKRRRHA